MMNIFALEPKPSFNWLYGLEPNSDIFTIGAICLQAVPGTDLNHINGANP
jgi:hypothetical protein